MSDLIDRQAAIKKFSCVDPAGTFAYCDSIIHTLEDLPSADIQDRLDAAYMHGYTAAEARYRDALQHGHWVASDEDGFVCSVCRCGYKDQPTMMGKPMFEHCPVCGARMDGEQDG